MATGPLFGAAICISLVDSKIGEPICTRFAPISWDTTPAIIDVCLISGTASPSFWGKPRWLNCLCVAKHPIHQGFWWWPSHGWVRDSRNDASFGKEHMFGIVWHVCKTDKQHVHTFLLEVHIQAYLIRTRYVFEYVAREEGLLGTPALLIAP